MPFKSESQRRYLFMHEPKVAKKWAEKYGTPKNLPKKVKRKKRKGNPGAFANALLKQHKRKG